MGKIECGEIAAMRFTWPGSDESFCCIEHAMQLQKVAKAMGLHLQMIPVSYQATGHMPTFIACRQKVSPKKISDDEELP
jgi:hypothetical protein